MFASPLSAVSLESLAVRGVVDAKKHYGRLAGVRGSMTDERSYYTPSESHSETVAPYSTPLCDNRRMLLHFAVQDGKAPVSKSQFTGVCPYVVRHVDDSATRSMISSQM